MTESVYSQESLMNMEPMLLRALLRERVHHTIECRLYSALYGHKALRPLPEDVARRMLKVWRDRNLPEDGQDIQWALHLIDAYDRVLAGERTDIEGMHPHPFGEAERQGVERAIFGRRSYRQWSDQDVSRSVIDRIIEAGMWAPTACDIQPVRFLVLDTKEALAQVPSREFSGEKVKIILCVDTRAYEVRTRIPKRNQYFDCAAAAQNMVLMAEVLGLGAVWSTFNERDLLLVKEVFVLPDYLEVCTYISMGYASESVLAPGRMDLRDVVLLRTSSR
jgi:nitroreductase